MKTLLSLIILSLVLTTGCVSMPKSVNPAYIKNKTVSETNKMDATEEKIIAKNKEKEKAKKALKQDTLTRNVYEQKIAITEQEKELLIQQQKLYSVNENSDKLSEVQAKIAKNKKDTQEAKAYYEYYKVKAANSEEKLELISAELAVFVADLEYQKAVIAHRYVEKIKQQKAKEAQAKGAEKEEDEEEEELIVDILAFEKYLDKQRDKLKSQKETYRESTKDLKKATSKLQTAGYEVK